jgi:hypothetical protein
MLGFQVLRSPSRIELAEAFNLQVAGILASAARNSPASAQMLEQCALAKGPIAVWFALIERYLRREVLHFCLQVR